MGTSLAFGVGKSLASDGWVIMLADMPYIKRSTIELVATQLKKNNAEICAPYYRNQRGHPVSFSEKYKTELMNLQGESGARIIIENNQNNVTRIDCDDPSVLADVDTPADIKRHLHIY